MVLHASTGPSSLPVKSKNGQILKNHEIGICRGAGLKTGWDAEDLRPYVSSSRDIPHKRRTLDRHSS